MKKFIKNTSILALSLATLFLTSCNEDETLEREGKPTVTLLSNEVTASEGFGANIDFDFSYQIKEEAQVRIEVIGGTAEEGVDYDFNIETIEDAGFGYFGGEGYLARIPAFSNSYLLSNFISITDDGIDDDNETIVLKITSVSKGTILINEIATITIGTCPLESTSFVGDYLIEQISVEIDGPTLSDGTVVTLTAVDATTRSFPTLNYPDYVNQGCPNTMNFQIVFSCNNVDSIVQDSQCPCADGTNWFGPAESPEAIDITDDSEFLLTFTDDLQTDCGAPAQTTYRFTKQ